MGKVGCQDCMLERLRHILGRRWVSLYCSVALFPCPDEGLFTGI